MSGYPVSLDGGSSVSFIGHGTEWVGMKKSEGGKASSAFVVPFDTPKTKSNPNLTGKRMQEAKKGGYVLPGYASGGKVEENKPGVGKEIHPLLTKMNDKNIKKSVSAPGLCVTGSLDTMQKSGVPNPAATGNDVGNNPRGAIVQLIRSFGWKSIGGKSKQLNSPYGKVTTGMYSKSEYAKAVDDGLIPSGALIFQTRHSDWDGTSYNSRGYDMAISQKKGRALWNGQSLGQWVYGNTTNVIALSPGGKAGDGTSPGPGGDSPSDTPTNGKGSDPAAQGQQSDNWWDTLGKAFTGETARQMLGVKDSSSTASSASNVTPAVGAVIDPAKASEIKPSTPTTPTGSQVLQQSAQLKDAKSAETSKPQVATINNNQGTTGAIAGGGTIAINTAGGTKKNNTDFLVPIGSPFTNFVSPDALAVIK